MEDQAHQNELRPRAVQFSIIQCPNEYFQKSNFAYSDKHYTIFLPRNFVRAFFYHRDEERVPHCSLAMIILLVKTSTTEVM